MEQEIEFIDAFSSIRVRNECKKIKKLRLLKICFQLNREADTVECSIPFGWISRSIVDIRGSEFEFPGLNWISYGDPVSRFALVSDHLHGYGMVDGLIGISVSKTPYFPDPSSGNDHGLSEFVIVPSSGDHRSNGFNRLVSSLLTPPLVLEHRDSEKDDNGVELPIADIRVESESVAIDSFCISLDRKGVMIRMHEYSGRTSGCILKSSMKYELFETDLIEKIMDPSAAYHFGDKIKFDPFEIKTLKVVIEE